MQLSDSFLEFSEHQLARLGQASDLRHLGLYLSENTSTDGPTLVLIRQWSKDTCLPSAENDSELRFPSPARRWYPLQDGEIILGALRADITPPECWTQDLDEQLRRCGISLSYGLSRDIECLKLRHELHARKEQLRTLIHQLRNPLSALRTYAQLLLRRLDEGSDQRALVKSMLEEQKQLGRYIDALEGASQQRIFIGEETFCPLLLPPSSPSDKETFKQQLMPLIERAQATANLQGRRWKGPENWPSWASCSTGDGSLIEIVANLLENAFRYSPTDCEIGLCLQENGLCVWDTGKPIALEERSIIFERGIRGSSGISQSGTGLGLALARRLAERINGKLELSIHPIDINPLLPLHGNAFQLKWPGPEKSE